MWKYTGIYKINRENIREYIKQNDFRKNPGFVRFLCFLRFGGFWTPGPLQKARSRRNLHKCGYERPNLSYIRRKIELYFSDSWAREKRWAWASPRVAIRKAFRKAFQNEIEVRVHEGHFLLTPKWGKYGILIGRPQPRLRITPNLVLFALFVQRALSRVFWRGSRSFLRV